MAGDRKDTQIDLLSPDVPMLGMRSSPDPAGIPAGYWDVAQNVRISYGRGRARREPTKLNNSAFAANITAVLGVWAGWLNGSYKMFAAFEFSGSGTSQVYEINHSAWTAAALPNGFGSGVGRRYQFAPYRDPGLTSSEPARDFLFVTTDDNVPLVVDPVTPEDLVYEPPQPNVSTPDPTVKPGPSAYVVLKDKDSTNAISVTGSGFAISETTSDDENEVTVVHDVSAAAVGDTFYIDINVAASGYNLATNAATQGLQIGNAEEIWFVFADVSTDSILNYIDIDVTISAATTKIYSCTGINKRDPAIIDLGGGYYLASIILSYTGGAQPTGLVTRFTATLQRIPAADRTFKVAGILAGGVARGGSAFPFSYGKIKARSETRAYVPRLLRVGPCAEYGMTRNLTQEIPITSLLQYMHRLFYYENQNARADRIFVYRQEPPGDPYSQGDAKAYFVGMNTVSNTDGRAATYADTTRRRNRNLNRTAPRLTDEIILFADSCASAGDRLFVGGGGLSGLVNNRVFISEQGFPLRFVPLADDDNGDGFVDPASGLILRFAGEAVRRIEAMQGLSGLAPVLVFTDKAVRRLDGTDALSLGRPTMVCPHGTVYPESVAQNEQTVIYLDTDKKVRGIFGGINSEPLSLDKIDDQLEATTFTKHSCSIWWKENYYLAGDSDANGTMDRVYVYNTRIEEFVRDAYTSRNWQRFLMYDNASPRYVIGFDSNGDAYKMEDPSNASRPTLTLTKSLADGNWERRYWGAVRVTIEKDATTWSTARVDPGNSANTSNGTGTLNLNTTPEHAWLEDRTSAGNGQAPGLTSPSVTLTISGGFTPGKNIRRIAIVTAPRSGGGYSGSG